MTSAVSSYVAWYAYSPVSSSSAKPAAVASYGVVAGSAALPTLQLARPLLVSRLLPGLAGCPGPALTGDLRRRLARAARRWRM